MRTIDRSSSLLLVIDLQQRLLPAIADGGSVLAATGRLIAAARLLEVPRLVTEENPAGLGPTLPALLDGGAEPVVAKMHFDACREPGFLGRLGDRRDIVVTGCEAHVCVLQTVLGLLDAGRRVHLVRDAIGSRRSESKDAAIARASRHGAEIVTTEMVVFEWLGTATDPRFRPALALVR